jgi:N4-gp56 family major capsid protein
MYSDNLSKNLRMELMAITKFRQFCDVKDAAHQGKSKGDLFHWNVYSSVATQGGTIAETNTMPETNFTIRQGTLTITEYGNSVPYSGKLDDLSEHPVKEIINKVLRFDAGKAFDFAAFDQFNACKLRIGATATAALGTLDTAGTCATTNNIALSKSHIPLLVNEMKERNIPPYTGDDYYALGWPETFVTLKTGLEGVYQYTQTGFGRIVNGEIGRYQSVRFVEQTNCKKGGAADSTTYNKITTADAWNNAKSDWAFFFGSDTVGEGIAVPEQMRGKIPSDYGRSKGVAWYYLGGFGLVHTDALNGRILKWDSAA